MSELINRAAAILVASGYCHSSNIAAELAKLPVIPGQQWIPCSERPPEKDGEYLVTVKYGYDGGYEEVFVDSMDWHKGHWSNFFFSHPGMVESILAWMPFPEPYKEEQE